MTIAARLKAAYSCLRGRPTVFGGTFTGPLAPVLIPGKPVLISHNRIVSTHTDRFGGPTDAIPFDNFREWWNQAS